MGKKAAPHKRRNFGNFQFFHQLPISESDFDDILEIVQFISFLLYLYTYGQITLNDIVDLAQEILDGDGIDDHNTYLEFKEFMAAT